MAKAFAVLLVFGSACALSAALVPLAAFLARRLGILDKPGLRKVHSRPTPRLGGVAVFLAFLGIVLGGYLVIPALSASSPAREVFGAALEALDQAHRVRNRLLALLAGASLAFTVGLADDVFGQRFPVWLKALGQVVAALVLVFGDVGVSFLPWSVLNLLLTVFWVVGITNAFNLLDNMDGLSAGVALIASSVLLLNAWPRGELFIVLLLVAFMGSLFGFLFHNFNPASIFLGDCGSLFIGYVMGSLMLLERYVTHSSSTLFPVLMPVVVLAVPIVDTATVVVIRLRTGQPIYVGDANHLSHRLVALGLSKRAAVLFIYLTTLCLGIGAVFLSDASLTESVLILGQTLGFVALLLILMFVKREPAAGGAA